MIRWSPAVLVAVGLLAAPPLLGHAPEVGAGPTTTSTGRPTGVPFDGLPEVGALFAGASDSGPHFCTAAVVDSPRHDLLITAAHCVSGTGVGLVFAPGYHDGTAPHGVWRVTGAYAGTAWLSDRDPRADVAFLTVGRLRRDGKEADIEDVVGGARLEVSTGYHLWTTVVGYPAGVGGRPVTCTNWVGDHVGYLSFDCGGFVGGTSGGPFLTPPGHGAPHGAVVGVIGGLHQGGCTPAISYSAVFTVATAALYRTATSGRPGDTLPAAGSDDC